MMLEKDSLSGGLLSGLVNRAWAAKQAGIKANCDAAYIQDLTLFMINTDDEIFENLVENMFVPSKDLHSTDNPLQENIATRIEGDDSPRDQHVTYFDTDGCLFYDGMHAAGFGRFRYVYRGKGTRVVWFKSGYIGVYAVYATIDESGSSLAMEQIDGFTTAEGQYEDITNWVDYSEFQQLPDYELLGDIYFWCRYLCNLNMPYNKAFFLEYIITPSDVNIISEFSLNCRYYLWLSIFGFIKQVIETEKANENAGFIHFAVQFMQAVSAPPDISQLLEFVTWTLQKTSSRTDPQIIEVISLLRNGFARNDEALSAIQNSVLATKQQTELIKSSFESLNLTVSTLRSDVTEERIDFEMFSERLSERIQNILQTAELSEIKTQTISSFPYLINFIDNVASAGCDQFLLTAEYVYGRLLSKGIALDGAVSIIGYAKIVEKVLSEKVGKPAINYQRQVNPQWRGFTSSARNQPIIPNTFGSWELIAINNSRDFAVWVNSYFSNDPDLAYFLVHELGMFTKKMRLIRNKAAHDSAMTQADVEQVRDILLKELDSKNVTLMERCVSFVEYQP